ncbi:MAG: Gfo/Idh/MocA family oxidoreductase [Verrucomicrobia bacterium]|nr:Gfo/Idh/MocA family oxidoreductase [Verrucomicrobiota bacterium]
MKPSPVPVSRRRFLTTTATAAAFSILPGVRGQNSPNNKLNIAGIGVGGQGGSDLNSILRESPGENIVALCDVNEAHAGHTFKKFPAAKIFKDYRKMLDEMKEIDAIVVGTPDHHHAFASMEGIKRGKHVYCEKPLTHSVWEARHVAEAARKAKVVTQMGNQGAASEDTRRLCELIWAGAIGKVREAHIWTDRASRGLFEEYWPQGVERPKETPPVPPTLEWDLWLGPAPERPYHPAYLPMRWRGWWDFGTGALGDIGCHSMDPVFRALKLGAPASVEACSTRVNTETFPLASMVTYQFPARGAEIQAHNPHVKGLSGTSAGAVKMPPLKLVWYDGGLRPSRPAGLDKEEEMGTNGRLIIGDDGFIFGTRMYPEARRKQFFKTPRSIPRVAGHYVDWVEACKTGRKSGADFDWAGPLAEAVLLGNVPLRRQLREAVMHHPLQWDSVAFRFTNLEEANKFLRRDYRAGWTL